MATSSPSRHNPLFTIAAVAVILFSGVGIATMTGLIPASQSKTTVTTGLPTDTGGTLASDSSATAPGAAPAHGAPAGAILSQSYPERPATLTASASVPQQPPQTATRAAAAPILAETPAAPPAPPCPVCGTVANVTSYQVQGQGTGLGAVGGGLLGAIVGHQVGSGNGNTAATVLAGVGGAFAGNAVEKNVRKTTRYKLEVTMADGSRRNFDYGSPPAFATGDRVRVENGQVLRN